MTDDGSSRNGIGLHAARLLIVIYVDIFISTLCRMYAPYFIVRKIDIRYSQNCTLSYVLPLKKNALLNNYIEIYRIYFFFQF